MEQAAVSLRALCGGECVDATRIDTYLAADTADAELRRPPLSGDDRPFLDAMARQLRIIAGAVGASDDGVIRIRIGSLSVSDVAAEFYMAATRCERIARDGLAKPFNAAQNQSSSARRGRAR